MKLLRGDLVPAVPAGLVDRFGILEHAVAQVVLTHPQSHPPHRHQLRCVRRQKQQRHRCRHAKGLGPMPAGAVKYQHHVRLIAGSFGDHSQVNAHQRCTHRWSNQRRQCTRERVRQPEYITPLILGLPHRARSAATLIPHALQRPLPPGRPIRAPYWNQIRYACQDEIERIDGVDVRRAR